jgi:hypothetical protein
MRLTIVDSDVEVFAIREIYEHVNGRTLGANHSAERHQDQDEK